MDDENISAGVENKAPTPSPIREAYKLLDEVIWFGNRYIPDVVVATYVVGWANRILPYAEERPIIGPEGEPGSGKTRLLDVSSRVCEDFGSPRLGIDFSAASLYRLACENGEYPPLFFDEIDVLDSRSKAMVLKILRGSYRPGGAVHRSSSSGRVESLRLGGIIWASYVQDPFDPATRDRVFVIRMEQSPKALRPLIMSEFETRTREIARSFRTWTEEHYDEIVAAYRDVQMPDGFSPRLTGISRTLLAVAPFLERETGRSDVRANLLAAMRTEAELRQVTVRLDDRFWMLPQLLDKAIDKVPVRVAPDVFLLQDLYGYCCGEIAEFKSLRPHNFSGLLRARNYILAVKEPRRRRPGLGSLSNALACVKLNIDKIRLDASKQSGQSNG